MIYCNIIVNTIYASQPLQLQLYAYVSRVHAWSVSAGIDDEYTRITVHDLYYTYVGPVSKYLICMFVLICAT